MSNISRFGERTLAELGDLVANPQSLLHDSAVLSRRVVPEYQPELDILSASRYPQAPVAPTRTRTARKRTASQQFYGGVILNKADERSESSNHVRSEERPSPKKKTRRATKGSDDDEMSRKQRGRPRLDTQDETAADRRRTQIRLAQRAYRHRKETTIAALKERVGQMESTIDQMNKTFSQLHDNLFESGILATRPALAQQLRLTTEKFAALAKAATEQDFEHEEESHNIAMLNHAASDEGFGVDYNESRSQQDPSEAITQQWGYEFSAGDQEEDVPRAGFQTDDSDQMSVSISTNNEFQQFHLQIPEMQIDWQKLTAEIERPLKTSGPYTYSFQETTFARRLHRMSLETGYRHLMDPKPDPEYISRAFKFTFCFSNRKRMLIRFQELLKRKAGESLENWDVPFFQIGGAGTHFPRRDENGNPIYPPNMVSPNKLFGPQVSIIAETPRQGESVEEMLENIGFGGEWFDSHDVEEYLKTKGIYLDGTSSFVDVDPSLISIPTLTDSSPSAISTSNRSHTHTPDPSHLTPVAISNSTIGTFINDFGMHMSSLQDKMTDFNSFGGSMWDSNAPSYQMPASPGDAAPFEELLIRTQAPVTVDVNKFLNRMVQDAGVCLGRAPGFRRQQVDNALALSIQEAF